MKYVVLGVTGSVAAYKACDIISQLKKHDVEVRVILTKAATEFITPLALESLSHAPVVSDMFSRSTPWEIEHISLAKKADCFLIAPASANFIGKAAAGIADDMLTTTLLATKAPVLIAAAMNTNMYLHPKVQENIDALKKHGCRFIEPSVGPLACGDTGVGRLAPTSEIVEQVLRVLAGKQDLLGKNILVSAGPTQEKIDPVRYITNRSTGKMGYAIAEAASIRGANVTLISGPVHCQTPQGVCRVDVISTKDMYEAVNARFDLCDAVIMAAAPADFTPIVQSEQKIKKNALESGLTLSLKSTQDILAAMGQRKTHQRMLGFAAETEALEKNACEKLKRKNLDMIAANDVSEQSKQTGFGVDTNAVTLYRSDGKTEKSGLMTKRALSDWLLDRLFDEE